jgi:hypothetical protein
LVAALMGVMVGLPTVGRHWKPGEQPARDACELLPLAEGEKISRRRSRRGPIRTEKAQPMAGTESAKTTKLYDRTSAPITLDEVELIAI